MVMSGPAIAKAKLPILVIELGITVFLQPATIVFDAVSTIALQLLRESYVGLPESTVIVLSPVHPIKATPPIYSTDLGIAIDVKLLQPKKTEPPRYSTELGIVIEVRLLQPQKAALPMLVTELGIFTDVRFSLKQKA